MPSLHLSSFTPHPFTLHPFTLSLFTLSLFTACNKDNDNASPEILLITDSSFVFQDSMLQINQKVKIGIEAHGGATLTYLGVKLEADGHTYFLLDSGMHCPSFRYERIISKGAANIEKWIFTVMDENRNTSTQMLVFSRDPSSAFGNIVHHPSLILGAQDNMLYSHCLSLPSGYIFTNDSATAHQEWVDIMFYYNPGGGVPPYECTFSSPGENDAPAFYPFISSWTVHNSTYYNPATPVTQELFNGCANDSLLLASYDESNGKRKFKNTAIRNIIPFKTQQGKKGLILVKGLNSGPEGWVEIEVKVQE
jgi:hypothetical protein